MGRWCLLSYIPFCFIMLGDSHSPSYYTNSYYYTLNTMLCNITTCFTEPLLNKFHRIYWANKGRRKCLKYVYVHNIYTNFLLLVCLFPIHIRVGDMLYNMCVICYFKCVEDNKTNHTYEQTNIYIVYILSYW